MMRWKEWKIFRESTQNFNLGVRSPNSILIGSKLAEMGLAPPPLDPSQAPPEDDQAMLGLDDLNLDDLGGSGGGDSGKDADDLHVPDAGKKPEKDAGKVPSDDDGDEDDTDDEEKDANGEEQHPYYSKKFMSKDCGVEMRSVEKKDEKKEEQTFFARLIDQGRGNVHKGKLREDLLIPVEPSAPASKEPGPGEVGFAPSGRLAANFPSFQDYLEHRQQKS